MKEVTIYRSPEGKVKILAFYDKLLSQLGFDYEDVTIETRFGSTHIITAGPKDGYPMILFHGGNSLNPFDLKNFISLADKYRIYAPDTIGHPGKSAEVRLSPKNYSYGEWAIDILDCFKLNQPIIIGPSFGGGFLLQLATLAPERISAAVFIVPSGFANGSGLKIMRKLVIPLLRYRLFPNRKNAIKTLLPLVHNVDEDMLNMTILMFSHLKIASHMPRPMKKEELKNFKTPTLIIAADNDILFPGKSVIKRAKQIIPNLVETKLLSNTKHAFYTGAEENLKLVKTITRNFLQHHIS